MKTRVLLTGLLIVFFTQTVESKGLSAEECLEIGFRKSDLSCLRCEELIKFDLFSLKAKCRKCCRKDANEGAIKKYSSARLEVCNCNLQYYPQIDAYVKEKRGKRFVNFSVKYVGGTQPVMKLFDSKGREVDALNVEKWDTETIDEYLNQHLK